MEKANSVEFKVYGRYALFTDPLTKIGGEKFTYQIPTYQALKGILESVYWKPTFIWIIDQVRVMKSIQTESQGIRPIHYQDAKNELSIYTYLRDVEYQVKAHFEWNEQRPELVNDRNEDKHYQIAKRMIARGGRRDIFLGTRECQGYVEPVRLGEDVSYYDGIDLDFGLMYHGLTYSDEAYNLETEGHMTARFWSPKMKNGFIHFDRPEDCRIQRDLGVMKMKSFDENNFSGFMEFDKDGDLIELD